MFFFGCEGELSAAFHDGVVGLPCVGLISLSLLGISIGLSSEGSERETGGNLGEQRPFSCVLRLFRYTLEIDMVLDAPPPGRIYWYGSMHELEIQFSSSSLMWRLMFEGLRRIFAEFHDDE